MRRATLACALALVASVAQAATFEEPFTAGLRYARFASKEGVKEYRVSSTDARLYFTWPSFPRFTTVICEICRPDGVILGRLIFAKRAGAEGVSQRSQDRFFSQVIESDRLRPTGETAPFTSTNFRGEVRAFEGILPMGQKRRRIALLEASDGLIVFAGYFDLTGGPFGRMHERVPSDRLAEVAFRDVVELIDTFDVRQVAVGSTREVTRPFTPLQKRPGPKPLSAPSPLASVLWPPLPKRAPFFGNDWTPPNRKFLEMVKSGGR